MKKKLAVLMAGILGAFILGGCGDTGQTASQEGGVENIRLMVWAPSGDQSKDKGEWLQTNVI